MTDHQNAALPAPSGGSSQALTLWIERQAAEEAAVVAAIRHRTLSPYAAIGALAIAIGFGAATVATQPAMTDSVEMVASISAVDARAMGMALDLDPTGQSARTAAVNRDVGAMKSEIARLKRALDQSKANQTASIKAATSQAASGEEQVRALKAEIAALQKNLDSSREAAAAKIEALAAKLDQPKQDADAAHLNELKSRLDRIENRTVAAVEPVKQQVAAAPKAEPKAEPKSEPEVTGSIAQASQDAAPAAPAETVVRNWVVREVYDGMALLAGRQGLIEVSEGARVPGLGKIRGIEKRAREWVVLTDRGVILQR